MRVRAALAAALLLAGCAQAQQIIGANPQVAAGAAIAVEARVGRQCVDRAKSGDLSISAAQVRVAYARIGVDMALRNMLSQAALEGIDRARELTDQLCPALPVPAPSEAPPGE